MPRTKGLLHYRVTNYRANGLELQLGLVVCYSALARQFDPLLSVTTVNGF